MKKMIAYMLTGVLTLGLLAGCGSSAKTESQAAPAADSQAAVSPTVPATAAPAPESVPESQAEEAEDEENYETGDASLDDPRNGDDIGSMEILVVSFGTSYNDSRRETIGAIEEAIEDEFGEDWSIRRAFTSQIIIDHVKARDGEEIDNVTEALDRAVENEVETLVVQPTHLMNGFEYNDLSDELAEYADSFDQIVLAEPLLSDDDDFEAVAEAIVEATEEYDDGETGVVFSGEVSIRGSDGYI